MTHLSVPDVAAEGSVAFEKLYDLTGRWDYDQYDVSSYLVKIRAALTGEDLTTFEEFYALSGRWDCDHQELHRLADMIRAALTAE
jgi:hypothetical protein